MNNIELTLLKIIIDANKKIYPFLEKHIPVLYVKSRENTGVGIYTNFEYSKDLKENNINAIISSNKDLRIQGFTNVVNYVLYISDGRISFLEIVTNGDDVFTKDKFDYDFEID